MRSRNTWLVTALLVICLSLIVAPVLSAPVANFTGTPRQGLAPITVQFTDTSTGSPTSWLWNFGDGSTSTDQNPSHTFTSANTYDITLKVTNSGGSNSITKNKYIAALTQSVVPDFSPTNIYVSNPEGVRYDYPDGTPGGTYVYVPNTYYLWFDTAGGGLNPLHFTGTNVWNTADTGYNIYGNVTTTRNQAGTFYITFTGGRSSYANAVLMLAVNGTIPDDFSVHVTSSGYEGGIDETFYKKDFLYGPQITKPSSSSGYPIFSGQDTGNSSNTYQVMFIDLYSGATTANTGYLTVNYSFTDLKTFAAFNVYGWQITDNHGTGIHMTNSVTGTPGTNGGANNWLILGIPAAPVVDFSNSTATDDITSPVQFTDTSINTPTSWLWDFGDSSTSTDQNPTHTYSAVGSYTVILTATNYRGSSTATKTITKKHLNVPVPAFTATPTSGISPLFVQFNDTSINTPTSWYWDFGDGTNSGTLSTPASPNVTHWYAPGIYTVNLTSTNGDGSASLVKNNYITVTSNGRENQIINPGFETGDLTSWSPSGLSDGSHTAQVGSWSSSSNYRLPHSGSYSLRLVASGTSVTQYVDLTNVSTISWYAISNNAVAKNHYLYLDSLSSSKYTAPATWTKLTYSVPAGYSGIHAVTITHATSGSGTSGTFFDDITAIPSPAASFTASPVNGRAPLTVQFTDTSTGPSITGWSWDFGDSSSENNTVQNPVHTFTSPGTYTVKLTATNAGGSSTATRTGLVTVKDFIGVMPGYTGVFVNVANSNGARVNYNNDNTYYINTNGGGLGAVHITNDTSNSAGQNTRTTSQSGSFYITDTSGFEDEIVLLLAVNGTLPDDFSAHITTSGYSWTPSSVANAGPSAGSYTYQAKALDETFTKNDFIYGPQNWKPIGSNKQYPLFYGEDLTNAKNQYLLMFVDTRVGALSSVYNSGSLTNNGAVKVDYSFNYLPSTAVFNAYGLRNTTANGRGMGWTNDADDEYDSSGYLVYSSHPVTPVANFTTNQTTGIAPFTVRFQDTSDNTPTSWSWIFGDGGTSTSQNPKYTYTTSGTYSVKLTAKNDGGSNTSTKAGYIVVSAPVSTTSSFTLAGVTTNSGTGTNQTVTIPIANATTNGNVVNVTGVGSSWDHLSVTLTSAPASDGANVTGNVSSVVAVTAPVTVPLTSLSNSPTTGPNVTLSVSMSQVPGSTASLVGTISSDPDTAHQSSFAVAAANANQQIVATAYTITYTKTNIANAADGGSNAIIKSATITMAVSPAWVAANGGTGHIVILHQGEDGTSTLLTTTFTGTDSAGNDVFTAVSPTGLSIFTLSAVSPVSSGSSGSSGFSTGGGSEGNSFTSTSAVVTASGVAAGQAMTFAVNKGLTSSSTYGISAVSLVPTKALGPTQLTVSDAGNSISSSTLAGRQVAGIFQVEPVGVNPSSVSSGTITFVLDGSWLTAHSLTPENIVLLRDVNGQWTELPTTFVSQSGTAYTFSATTPGFSYFAIAGKTGAGSAAAQTTSALQAAASPAVPTPTTPFAYTPRTTRTTAMPVAQQAAPTVAASAPATGSGHFPIVIGIAAAGIVLIVAGVFLVRRWWIRRQNPALFRKYD